VQSEAGRRKILSTNHIPSVVDKSPFPVDHAEHEQQSVRAGRLPVAAYPVPFPEDFLVAWLFLSSVTLRRLRVFEQPERWTHLCLPEAG
jgi:hypothetical protein